MTRFKSVETNDKRSHYEFEDDKAADGNSHCDITRYEEMRSIAD